MCKSKWLVNSVLLVLMGGASVSAEMMPVYMLNPIVITAERQEKTDLETPSTTEIITEKDIKEKGYTSVFDALEHTVGITAFSYGPGGKDGGGHVSRVMIRGMDKGTLVLVNGAPINVNNYASTSGIPIEAVEKIEVIKGASSTLYGAEALAGVVNIITKRGGESHVTAKVGYGNYDKMFGVGAEGEKFNFWVQRDYSDAIDQTSRIFPKKATYQAENKGYRTSWYTSVNLTDKLTLDWSHVDNHQNIWYMYKYKGGKAVIPPAKSSLSDYHSRKDNVNLIYNNKEHRFRSMLAYNSLHMDGNKRIYTKPGIYETDRINVPYHVQSVTFDNQKEWIFRGGEDSLIGGLTYNGEHYKRLNDTNKRVYRDSYSAYLSWNHEYNERLSSTIGFRMQEFMSNGWDRHYDVFLPQLQFLYKLNDNWSLYSNMGKAFDMPAINSKYYSDSKKLKNASLKPQKGWTYEVGAKHVTGRNSFKAALFHMDIKDKFTWVKEDMVIPGGDPNTSVQINGGDFRNTGLELEYTRIVNDNWRFNAGITFQNPEINDSGKWVRDSAKLQYNLGIQYEQEKWGVGVDLFVTADREYGYYTNNGEYASRKGADHKIRDRIMLNSTIEYRPNRNQAVTLNMYNILDRENCTNKYENWDLPFSWRIDYQYKF